MKKAIFTPLLVLFTLLILISLAYTITKAEKSKEEIITGELPVKLINIYNEGEKLSFYLDESIKVSLKNTENILKENAGYPKSNNCKKQDGIIIWNNCKHFDVDENFNNQFKEELDKYIQLYQKQLPEPAIENNNVVFRDIKFSKDISSRLIKEFSAEYTLNKEIEYKYPDLSIYNNLYTAAQSCNLRPSISDNEINNCINTLKSVENTEITRNNDYLEIENKDIKFLINLKESLQLPISSLTTP